MLTGALNHQTGGLFRLCGSSVCVRSVILTGDRFLDFKVNRNSAATHQATNSDDKN
jgi:hypothetical protein